MKNLKKLSVAIMLATLFSTSFTSCIDNEVSPVVEAIYQAQADLLAAQSKLETAKAELVAAQAKSEIAAAANLAAITESQIAQAAANTARTEAETAAFIAQAQADIAKAAADLAQTEARTAAILATSQDAAAIAAANAAQIRATAAVAEANAAKTRAEAAGIEGATQASNDLAAENLRQSIANHEVALARAAEDLKQFIAAAEAAGKMEAVRLLTAQATLVDLQSSFDSSAVIRKINDRRAEANFKKFVDDEEQNLIALTAATDLAVKQGIINLNTAQANYDRLLKNISAALRGSANTEAALYAGNYATALGKIATLKSRILVLKGSIANNKLFMQSIVPGSQKTWEVYLAELQRSIAAKEAEVVAAEDYITRANKYLTEDLEGMKVALQTATDAVNAKQKEINVLNDERGMIDNPLTPANEASGLLGAIDTEIARFITDYNTLRIARNGYEAAITTLQGGINTANTVTIPDLTASITNYDAKTTMLEQAVVTVEDEIGRTAASAALDHAHNHLPAAFGLKNDIALAEALVSTVAPLGQLVIDVNTATTALGTAAVPVVGNSPINPANAAYEKLFNADLAILKHDAAFAALTATLNTAAIALANGTTTFNAGNFQANYNAAVLAQGVAQTGVDNGLTAYNTAKATFEANPSGSLDIDAPQVPGTIVDDVGHVGVHTDDDATLPGTLKTYLQITGFKAGTAPGQWIPDVLDVANPYNATQLAALNTPANLAALGVAAATDVIVWEQNGTSLDIAGAATLLPTNSSYLTTAEALDVLPAIAATKVYFLEVEADDASSPFLTTFNLATNLLGVDDFATRAITVNATNPLGVNPALTITDTNAFYTTNNANADGEYVAGGIDALTLQAALWNAKLDTAIKLFARDNSALVLQGLQDTYDAQKLLFDEGATTRNGLVAARALIAPTSGNTGGTVVDVATNNLATANTAVANQNTVITKLKAQLGLNNYNTRAPGSPFLAWDVHANDGIVPPAPLMYQVLASAGWDSDTTPGADKLTVYARLWNAKERLARHKATTKAGYEAQLATAEAGVINDTNLISENTILMTRADADLAALKTEYDGYIASPLHAQRKVRLLEITDELAILTAQKNVLTTEMAALAIVVNFGDFTTPAATLTSVAAINAAMATAQAVIDGAPAIIATKKAQIALGEVSVANLQDLIKSQEDEIVDLEAEIEIRKSEAETVKTLLEAAIEAAKNS